MVQPKAKIRGKRNRVAGRGEEIGKGRKEGRQGGLDQRWRPAALLQENRGGGRHWAEKSRWKKGKRGLWSMVWGEKRGRDLDKKIKKTRCTLIYYDNTFY